MNDPYNCGKGSGRAMSEWKRAKSMREGYGGIEPDDPSDVHEKMAQGALIGGILFLCALLIGLMLYVFVLAGGWIAVMIIASLMISAFIGAYLAAKGGFD